MSSHVIHQIASYGFLFSFLLACCFSILSIRRKEIPLERLSAWTFVVCFVLLCIAYVPGFGLEAALKGSPKAISRLAERHHDMAKFVLTGMTLATAASLTVLYKFRGQRFPNWFLPNLLFLAMMIATFSIRSMVYAFQLDNHPARHSPETYISPSPTPFQ